MKPHDHENIKSCCAKDGDLVSSTDPVCGMNVAEDDNSLHYEFQGTDFCLEPDIAIIKLHS